MPDVRRLERTFFARPAPQVAHDLVGALLVRSDQGLMARLVETEAYMQHDPACHAYRRVTARNAVLHGPPGHAYVYLSYGLHWCLNISTGSDGVAEGCLLRAAEPLEGHDTFRARRGARHPDRDLLRGPARLTQAFGLDGWWNGHDLCVRGPLRLADDGHRPEVIAGPRVGVSRAADWPWRFRVPDSAWSSAYVRSSRAPAAGTDPPPPPSDGGSALA